MIIICNMPNLVFLIMYVDSSSVLQNVKHLSNLLCLLNEEIYFLSTGLQHSKVSLNTRTQFLIFSSTELENKVLLFSTVTINKC